jgi:hypothetical protein
MPPARIRHAGLDPASSSVFEGWILASASMTKPRVAGSKKTDQRYNLASASMTLEEKMDSRLRGNDSGARE